MFVRKNIATIIVLTLAVPLASRADTITALGESATVVVVGALTVVQNGPVPEQLTLTLSAAKFLKGQTGGSIIVAGTPTGSYIVQSVVFPDSVMGQPAIWFLSQDGSGYHVVPWDGGQFADEFFLPITSSLAAATLSGNLEQQLLQYLVGWYQSLPNPTARDDMKCLSSLQSHSTNPQDALAVANSLIGSVRSADRTVGLTAAIGLSSDNAVAALSSLLPAIGSNPKFYLITNSLAIGYHPNGAASIPVLKQIVNQHSAAPGIDAAVGAALSKIVVKQTLPVMAELLTSLDPTARLRAASFFGLFTLFADNTGNVPVGGPMGPFATDRTRQYTPGANSGITPEQYSQFWLQWWTQNHDALGL
jgi:hypothetical protein